MIKRRINSHLKASIIVPVYNAKETLSACLDSLMALEFPKEDSEILLVDNNSNDGSKDIISRYPVVYLFEPNKGRGWARNRGVKNARGKYIVFFDADCVVKKDCLSILVDYMENHREIVACGGEVIAFKKETIFEKYEESERLLSQEIGIKGRNRGDIPRIVTANAIFCKDVLEEAGYFDEDLVTSEDTELSWRIHFLGHEVDYVSDAIVYHQHRQTFFSFFEHHFEYGLASGVLQYKYNTMRHDLPPSSSKIKAFFCSVKFFFLILASTLRSIFCRAKTKKGLFKLAHALHLTAFNLGMTVSLVRILFNRSYVSTYKGIPSHNSLKNFTVLHNNSKWSLNKPLSWFLKDELVRMITFSERLEVFNLNKSGTRIWKSLLETRNFQKTVGEIADFYGLSENVVTEDAEDFMDLLTQERIFKKDTAIL